MAPLLLSVTGMERVAPPPPGHYGALGVPPVAAQRQIERAFRDWGERLAAGRESVSAYRLAEAAYHVLSVPESRARHDRQLGLTPHPAWCSVREQRVADCVRRALFDLRRGRAGRARVLLARAAARQPRDPRVRSYLAVAIVRCGGDLHEAARHARAGVELGPREAAHYFNLAEVYAAAGLRAAALAARSRGWRAVIASVFRSRRRV